MTGVQTCALPIYKERFAQEIGLNLKGYYLNLVPGDASLEWMIKMGNPISLASLSRGREDVYNIFKEYFVSEVLVSRDKNRPFVSAPGRKRTDLRFFKSIISESLHDKIVADTATDPTTLFDNNADEIKLAIDTFIAQESKRTATILENYSLVKVTPQGFKSENIALPKTMSADDYQRHLDMLSINYAIANIEMHKLLYSDPYQYKDELKRIKSFNSPRQAIVSNSPKMNAVYSSIWNKSYKPGDIGYTEFSRDYFRSATHEDILGYSDLKDYDTFDETDGAGIISLKANRQFRIRAGKWNDDNERQYKYDVAWEKRDKGMTVSREEEAILRDGNPGIQDTYVNLKPIVSGNKANNQDYNDIVLDKFALYVMSYRIMKELGPESNMVKLYDKMQKENIDYIVFNSGRKVGARNPHATYNEDGSFNDSAYDTQNITNVPFSIMSVQSEVPSKEIALVTRGSQMTKLITMDYLEAGVPIDFFTNQPIDSRYKAWMKLSDDEKINRSPIYAEIKNNQNLLEALTEEGYLNTLDKLGIEEKITEVDGVKQREFSVKDMSKAVKALRDEILSREVNDNISDALQGFIDGKAVLEATPAYQQIRNILYSIADRNIVSPKISGGLKVQIPSSLLENNRVKAVDIEGKKAYTSDILKFYEDEDGKRVMEIMVARWFPSDKTDEELLDYFNNTEEGKAQLEALAGVAFRIPTQKQNSIDAFKIAKFLPKEFGDSVVVPSALVKKVGSDFDIDKLSIYLKNVYTDGKGNIKLIPFMGIGEEAKEKLKKSILAEDLKSIFSVQEDVIRAGKNEYEDAYRKSLENEYIKSCEKLVSHPKNFERLVKPNSADQLKGLAKFVAEKTTGGTFDYNDPGNMLDRRFMSRLRDRKSTRLNSSHIPLSRMPSSA